MKTIEETKADVRARRASRADWRLLRRIEQREKDLAEAERLRDEWRAKHPILSFFWLDGQFSDAVRAVKDDLMWLRIARDGSRRHSK